MRCGWRPTAGYPRTRRISFTPWPPSRPTLRGTSPGTGWRCAGIFADEGLSGTTLRRPRFAELLRLARSGAVDLILTKEVSRFARNTVDALQVTRRLREQGVGVIFLSDGIDTRDNDGEFRLTIMASVAQEESRKISERTRWGQLQAMRRGVAFGNDTVYGYALRGGALTIRPEQAEVVPGGVPQVSGGG